MQIHLLFTELPEGWAGALVKSMATSRGSCSVEDLVDAEMVGGISSVRRGSLEMLLNGRMRWWLGGGSDELDTELPLRGHEWPIEWKVGL